MTSSARAGRGTDRPPSVGARWYIPLWWLTTRRQWRPHGGALLAGLVVAIGLALMTRAAPVGGEPVYLTILLTLGLALIVSAPLVLSIETALSSRRIDLVPMSSLARWCLRIVFANSLRSVAALVIATWGFAVSLAYAPSWSTAALGSASVLGWVFAALALSQLLEDVIRHRRAAVLHQLVFLAALSLWPVLMTYLRDDSNFVPPPPWSTGAISILLLGGGGPVALALPAAVAPYLLGLVLIRLDEWFLARHVSRASPPPTGVRWTATLARTLSAPSGEASLLYKELLVPLRFLFVRMSIVFLVLTAAAAFASGIPYLLLSAVLWWQPLSTNALGPDVSGGRLRYALMGWSDRPVLTHRLVASLLLTLVAVVLTGALFALFRAVPRPLIGPDSPVMYPLTLLYSLSLMTLWAIAADRYSRRFPDALEMHTLLPERKRSAGAAALVGIVMIWIVFSITALGILLLALGTVLLIAPGAVDLTRITAIVLLASALNVGAYLSTRKEDARVAA